MVWLCRGAELLPAGETNVEGAERAVEKSYQ